MNSLPAFWRRLAAHALPGLALCLTLLTPLLADAHGISAEDRERMLSGGYVQYIGLGATHMLTGLYDAKLDHMPVLAICGQAARSIRGAHYQQEINLDRAFAGLR